LSSEGDREEREKDAKAKRERKGEKDRRAEREKGERG
jgi:hypothetical protein